jgi:hypothetical protein
MTFSTLAPFTSSLMLAIAMLAMVFVGVWTRRIDLRPRTRQRRTRRRRHPHGGGAA